MNTTVLDSPTKTEMLLPLGDGGDGNMPEISIVIPALNELLTVGMFIDWCKEGLENAGVHGEILIVDSSKDDTWKIALDHGARVLRTPKKGLGQAYIDAIPYIRGTFIIMGDCDLTYDFRELQPFVYAYRQGFEYVMGSRFRGSIEDGAMPALHRYFGTPLTTWILNRIYGSIFTDIHCGMRGITKDALVRINLTSTGWEYASEMVLKASRLGLRIFEVPVHFLKDRQGRVSHHLRSGFWSPWLAGWDNLKIMLIYSPDTFLIKPGVFLVLVGILVTLMSIPGTVKLGALGFNVHMLMLGVAEIIFGYSLFQVGIIARRLHGLKVGIERAVTRFFSYDRGMVLSGLLLGLGLLCTCSFLWRYFVKNFQTGGISHTAIVGLLFIILSVQTFSFTLITELQSRITKRK